MAKLRLQKEWKLWISIGVLVVLCAGYLYWVSKPPTEGGEPLWRVEKVLDEKRLQLRGSGTDVEVTLAGLLIPASHKAQAQDFLAKTLIENWVRIKPVGEASEGKIVGLILLSGDDLNARMVRLGLAEIDPAESRFDILSYRELQREAQSEKRGIWAQPAQGAK